MGGHHNTTKAFNYELTGSQLYEAPHKLGTRAPQWLPEPRCRASDKQPTPSGPTTWHHDGDGQRRRQTKGGGKGRLRRSKTKTVSLWGRANWQLPYSWRHPRVNTELDTFLVRPAYSRANESCSRLCNPRSSRGTAPVRSFLNSRPGKGRIMKRWQSPQVAPAGLTED